MSAEELNEDSTVEQMASTYIQSGVALGLLPSPLLFVDVSVICKHTLLVHFRSEEDDRGELIRCTCLAMSFLMGALGDSWHECGALRFMAVRICGVDGDVKLESISSDSAIRACQNGDAITWMSGTQFIDYTIEYVNSRAHAMVSELERTLRGVIVMIMTDVYGEFFWSSATSGVNVSRMPAAANMVSDADKLEYTYLYHLKDIIVSNWSNFEHVFGSVSKVNNLYDVLNPIRRDVAHNRRVELSQLRALESLRHSVFYDIGRICPGLVDDYLSTAWIECFRDGVSEVGKVQREDLKRIESMRESGDEIGTCEVNVSVSRKYSEGLNTLLRELRSFPRSPSIEDKQNQAECLIERTSLCALDLARVTEQYLRGDVSVDLVLEVAEQSDALGREYESLTQEIIFS